MAISIACFETGGGPKSWAKRRSDALLAQTFSPMPSSSDAATAIAARRSQGESDCDALSATWHAGTSVLAANRRTLSRSAWHTSPLQFARHRPKHLLAQFRPHAAGRQSVESLFHVVVHDGCLANQVRIFAKAER